MEILYKKLIVPVAAVWGLLVGLMGMSWIVGSFGVSTTTARAIVRAVEVGSWGMFLVAIVATGGLVGAGLWGSVKYLIARAGRKAAIA